MDDIREEADALLGLFEQRGLTPQEACAVMGVAITALIADDATAREFLRSLKTQFMYHWAGIENENRN